ncbi:Hypothetical protein NTJ_01660 [Nesidiocoris tenuis]|uniref:Uncharacterized protein n=1 Tax=Nesidiocoris tenuis TaxID=355587 RepID=A0ABN7AA37_9HEMI|nr:Hypothetical protein NTJ_01660 [Nesidiocoris tenuis]
MSDKGAKSEDSKAAAKVDAAGKKKSVMDKLPPVLGKKASKSSEPGADTGKTKKKYTFQDRIKDIKTGIAELKANMKEKKNQFASAGGSGPVGSQGPAIPRGRQMLYPYTFTAKIAQFPYRFHWEKSWYFKYFLLGSLVSWPLFVIIGRKSNTPANVEEWRKHREELFGTHTSS